MIDAAISKNRFITAKNAQDYALSRFEYLYVRSMRYERPMITAYESAINPHEN